MANKVARIWDEGQPSPSPVARVLVVDDLPANRLALRAVVEPIGEAVEVVEASSGEEALRELLHGEFAVILMDVQMPGLDGLETANLIKARERSRHIPLIFITALSREAAYVFKGYQEGGVDYLLKPIEPNILRAKVTVFVELYLRGERIKQQATELAARRAAEQELVRTTQLEQQLVGIVGHDIRSPLSAILGTAQSRLRMGVGSESERKAFQRIVRSGERIHQVVNLLVDFTRARVGGGIPLARRQGDLNELCLKVVDESQAAHPGRHLEAELSAGALDGEWDMDRLAQVLANLLDNAVKYSPEGSVVRLRTRSLDDGAAHVEVHNEGPHIPQAQQALLFEPFARGSDVSETGTSLGLGLFIVREIVRGHGGSVKVDSTAERGTTFEVCLPKQAAGPDVPSPCGSVPPAEPTSLTA